MFVPFAKLRILFGTPWWHLLGLVISTNSYGPLTCFTYVILIVYSSELTLIGGLFAQKECIPVKTDKPEKMMLRYDTGEEGGQQKKQYTELFPLCHTVPLFVILSCGGGRGGFKV